MASAAYLAAGRTRLNKLSDLPDRVLEYLRALGADFDRLPEIPEELAEWISTRTPAELERIRQDAKELERIELVASSEKESRQED